MSETVTVTPVEAASVAPRGRANRDGVVGGVVFPCDGDFCETVAFSKIEFRPCVDLGGVGGGIPEFDLRGCG